jgi:hypothetical protein
VAAYRTVPVEGDTVVVELRLFRDDIDAVHEQLGDPKPADPFDTLKPLTARFVPSLPVADHIAQIKRKVMADDSSDEVATTYAGLGYVDALLDTPARTSRREVGNAVLLAVAFLYAAAVECGSKKPIKDIQQRLKTAGYPYSEGRIKTLVAQARGRRLLTRSQSKGKAGGTLTKQAREAAQRLRAK